MRNEQIKDDWIRRLVQSEEYEIPSELEEKINRKMNGTLNVRPLWRRKLIWIPASVVLLAFFFVPFLGEKPEIRTISFQSVRKPTVIKTEFELKDKNIKIVWFQKQNFNVRTAWQ